MAKGGFPFQVDESSDVPLWVQLRQRIIHLINTGHFKPGDQLPTVRGLAADISINYNTVNKAYLSLVSEGYLESARGRGVFVRDIDAAAGDDHAAEVDAVIADCIAACRDLGLSLDDVQANVTRKIRRMKLEERDPNVKPTRANVVEFDEAAARRDVARREARGA